MTFGFSVHVSVCVCRRRAGIQIEFKASKKPRSPVCVKLQPPERCTNVQNGFRMHKMQLHKIFSDGVILGFFSSFRFILFMSSCEHKYHSANEIVFHSFIVLWWTVGQMLQPLTSLLDRRGGRLVYQRTFILGLVHLGRDVSRQDVFVHLDYCVLDNVRRKNDAEMFLLPPAGLLM